MKRKRPSFAPAFSPIDTALESRIALSGVAAADAAQVAGRLAATHTTLSASTGTIGQPIALSVSVRAATPAGAPQGTVNIIDHGRVIQTLTLAPAGATSARQISSTASVTLAQPLGGNAYYFGKHALTAEFVPSRGFAPSTGHATFNVTQPRYKTLAGGVKVASINPGSGPAIQTGQTANVLYTGYLTRTGQVFDDSMSHGGTALGFRVGTGSVIPGFDAGVAGMQAGETRILIIPPSQAYGSKTNGPIPGNSTLTFVVTLQSIA
jgi:hypothetical protein